MAYDDEQGSIVTLYSGARSQRPLDAGAFTWPELVSELTVLANKPSGAPADADVEEQKKQMLAFAPHALRPGAARALDTVEAVTALVLDIDNGGDPERIVERLEALGAAGFIYESAKSTDEAPRFRVVSPVVEPIAPERCRETRQAFAELLGFEPSCGVAGAIDASKIFFLGKAHGTRDRKTWNVDGGPIDAAELPAPALAWGKAQAPGAGVAPHLASLPPGDAGIVAALGSWADHDGRRWDICGAIGGLMRKAHFSADECAAVIRDWLPADELSVDVEHGVQHALGAWRYDPDDVSGEGALAEHVGADHGRLVASAIEAAGPVGQALARIRLKRPQPQPQHAAWARAPITGGDPLGEALSFDTPDEPIDYYCKPLCLAPSSGKVSLIAGLPGHGKGPLADYLAMSFALGGGLFECQEKNVLFLDCEGSRLTKRRISRLCRGADVSPGALSNSLALRDTTRVDMMSDAFFNALERYGADVVIVDSYTSAALGTGRDPNKIEFADFAKMLGALGVLGLCVAHAKKLPEAGVRPTLSDVAGSGALGGMAATGITMWRPAAKRGEPEPPHLNVACMRAPEFTFAPFSIQFDDAPNDGLSLSVLDSETEAANEVQEACEVLARIANKCLAFMRKHTDPLFVTSFTAKQFKEGAGAMVGEPKLLDVLGCMARAGLIVYDPQRAGKTGGRFRLGPTTPLAVVFDGQGDCHPAGKRGDGSIAGFVRP